MGSDLNSIDKDIFIFLNRDHSPLLDKIMFLGRNLILWIPLSLLCIFIVFQYYKNKQRPHTLTKTVIFIIFIIFQLIICINIFPYILDPLVHRGIPFYDPEILKSVNFGRFYFPERADFYSAKVCLVVAIAVFFISFRDTPKWLKATLLLWTVLISYNRIYLGAHYPFNILLSDLLGVGVGLLTFYYFQYLKKSVMIIN